MIYISINYSPVSDVINLQISKCQCFSASSSGVHPWEVLCILTMNLYTSKWPLLAARWGGVTPSLFSMLLAGFLFFVCLIMNWQIDKWPPGSSCFVKWCRMMPIYSGIFVLNCFCHQLIHSQVPQFSSLHKIFFIIHLDEWGFQGELIRKKYILQRLMPLAK